jgi:integrase
MNLRGGDNVNSEIKMKAEEFLDYIRKAKSESTFKIYKRGLDLFSEYYGKGLDQILRERKEDMQSEDLKQRKRFAREVEMFHKWLLQPIHKIGKNENKPYPLNSAGSYSQGIMQLFRYFEMAVTIPTSSDVWKRHLTTKDYVPKPQQYREMYRVADNLKDKLIVSMGLNLAWRIGDFIKIRKDQLPNLQQAAPIPFELITEKEDVLAKSFLAHETVELLKEYLPTLTEDNPYLFPAIGRNGKKGYIDDWTVNQTLRRLAEKAKVVIPKRKRLRFHCFRKRFLSTCANLSIDVNIAKLLVGKDVEADMLTYLSEVEHRKAFLAVHNVLRLTEPKKVVVTSKDTTELEKEVQDLKRLVYGIYALGYGKAVEEAKKATKLEDITITPAHATPLNIEEIKEIGRKELEKGREGMHARNVYISEHLPS